MGSQISQNNRSIALRRHGFKCYFCHAPLVDLRSLPPESVHSIEPSRIGGRFWIGAEVIYRLIATATLRVPASEGGTRQTSNVVPSCIPCHQRREKAEREAQITDEERAEKVRIKWNRLVNGLTHANNPERYDHASLPNKLCHVCPCFDTAEESIEWIVDHLRPYVDAIESDETIDRGDRRGLRSRFSQIGRTDEPIAQLNLAKGVLKSIAHFTGTKAAKGGAE